MCESPIHQAYCDEGEDRLDSQWRVHPVPLKLFHRAYDRVRPVLEEEDGNILATHVGIHHSVSIIQLFTYAP